MPETVEITPPTAPSAGPAPSAFSADLLAKLRHFLIYDPTTGKLLNTGTCACGTDTCPDHILTNFPGAAGLSSKDPLDDYLGRYSTNEVLVRNGQIVPNAQMLDAQQAEATVIDAALSAKETLAALTAQEFSAKSLDDRVNLLFGAIQALIRKV